MKVCTISNFSEVGSDGHLSLHKIKEIYSHNSALISHFQETIHSERGQHIFKHHYSFLSVNWNLNSAPPVHVADKLFFIHWVSLLFLLCCILTSDGANEYYLCHEQHKSYTFSSIWKLVMERKALETKCVPSHKRSMQSWVWAMSCQGWECLHWDCFLHLLKT